MKSFAGNAENANNAHNEDSTDNANKVGNTDNEDNLKTDNFEQILYHLDLFYKKAFFVQ